RDRGSGERKEKTEWHRVVVFNENIVKVCEQYLRKGAKVYVEGAIQTRKWTDQAGVEKYSTEIVLQKFRGELTMVDGRGEGAVAGGAGALQLHPTRRDLLGRVGAGVDVVDLAFHELGDVGGLDAAPLGLAGREGRGDLARGFPIARADGALGQGRACGHAGGQ